MKERRREGGRGKISIRGTRTASHWGGKNFGRGGCAEGGGKQHRGQRALENTWKKKSLVESGREKEGWRGRGRLSMVRKCAVLCCAVPTGARVPGWKLLCCACSGTRRKYSAVQRGTATRRGVGGGSCTATSQARRRARRGSQVPVQVQQVSLRPSSAAAVLAEASRAHPVKRRRWSPPLKRDTAACCAGDRRYQVPPAGVPSAQEGRSSAPPAARCCAGQWAGHTR